MSAAPAPDTPPDGRPGALPRRDPEARARLLEVARQAAPLVTARERIVEVPGPLGALVPTLQRGTVTVVEGEPGAGATTLALALAGAVSRGGEWVAAVDPDGSLGGLALAEAGIAPERCAVVRRVPPDRWALVVAALLDGVALVVADPPSQVRAADARRLVARARERAAMLVVTGPWPAEAALRLHAEGSTWPGLGAGSGALGHPTVRARLESRRGTRRAALDPLALGA